MHREDHPPCPICQVGRLHLRLVTYIHVYDSTLVSVPNTPAWECDFCHTQQYDTHSVQRIEALIDQAGPTAQPPPHTPPGPDDGQAVGPPPGRLTVQICRAARRSLPVKPVT